MFNLFRFNFFLIVLISLALPRIEPTDLTPHVQVGETVSLPCKIVSGSPTPSRSWFRHDQLFKESTRRVSVRKLNFSICKIVKFICYRNF